MSKVLQDRLLETLDKRRERGLLRTLVTSQTNSSDFSSNDYLGLARNPSFRRYLESFVKNRLNDRSTGSTGSRLLSGHSKLCEELEEYSAKFHRAESALLFNSGYDANLSLLSCITNQDDVILYDDLIHASVHDGMKMGRARENLYSFSHNNVDSLRELILKVTSSKCKSIIICVETVYSMDGDIAPLKEMLDLAKQLEVQIGHDIHLIADEAHAGNLFGKNGEGLVVHLDLHRHPNLFARVITFGKAYALHGAMILGSAVLKEYLINYARPFIYSTALPPHSIISLLGVYHFAKSNDSIDARNRLWKLIGYFRQLANIHLPKLALLPTPKCSPIQGVLVPGNKQCMDATNYLRKNGFNLYGIRSPTVPKGTERIRVIIHAHNTEQQIKSLVQVLAEWFRTTRPRSHL